MVRTVSSFSVKICDDTTKNRSVYDTDTISCGIKSSRNRLGGYFSNKTTTKRTKQDCAVCTFKIAYSTQTDTPPSSRCIFSLSKDQSERVSR